MGATKEMKIMYSSSLLIVVVEASLWPNVLNAIQKAARIFKFCSFHEHLTKCVWNVYSAVITNHKRDLQPQKTQTVHSPLFFREIVDVDR